MNKYEMNLVDYFKFSDGQIALIGKIEPSDCKFIIGGSADLYVDGVKLMSIDIVGEDVLTPFDPNKRVIRTNCDIEDYIKMLDTHNVKLIGYYD